MNDADCLGYSSAVMIDSVRRATDDCRRLGDVIGSVTSSVLSPPSSSPPDDIRRVRNNRPPVQIAIVTQTACEVNVLQEAQLSLTDRAMRRVS